MMGLRDDIQTMEERRRAGTPIDEGRLAIAYAEMAERKSSQWLFWSWFDLFERQLAHLDRRQELCQFAGTQMPSRLGWRDAQDAVSDWLKVYDH
jgi:hypothetical protein